MSKITFEPNSDRTEEVWVDGIRIGYCDKLPEATCVCIKQLSESQKAEVAAAMDDRYGSDMATPAKPRLVTDAPPPLIDPDEEEESEDDDE